MLKLRQYFRIILRKFIKFPILLSPLFYNVDQMMALLLNLLLVGHAGYFTEQ